MKLRTQICLLAVAGNFYVQAGFASEPDPLVGWQAVQHPSMEAFFPENWRISKNVQGELILATSPKTGPADEFRETISIQLFRNPSARSVDSEKILETVLTEIAGSVEDFITTSKEWTQLGNNFGLLVRGSYPAGEETRFVMLFLIPVKERAYVAKAVGDSPEFGGLEGEIHSIYASLFPFKTLLGQTFFHRAFVIQFPKSWELSETIPGTIVAGISPKSNAGDSFRERLTLRYDVLKDPSEFETNVEKSFALMLEKFPGARESARGSLEISGVDGFFQDFSFGSDAMPINVRIVMILDEHRQFTFFYMGQSPEFEQIRPIADQIVNSFATPAPVSTLTPQE